MDETASKVPVTEEKAPDRPTGSQTRRPFDSLRREVDRLFEDFDRDFWRPLRRSAFEVEPFWRRQLKWGGAPAVDVAETDNAYEVSADLPGIDEKNIEVKLVKGGLTIKCERQEEKEEKKKDYYLLWTPGRATIPITKSNLKKGFLVPDIFDSPRRARKGPGRSSVGSAPMPRSTPTSLGYIKVTSRFLGSQFFGNEERRCRGSMVTRK